MKSYTLAMISYDPGRNPSTGLEHQYSETTIVMKTRPDPYRYLKLAQQRMSGKKDKERRLACLRCGHIWTPRKEGRPQACPACHSLVWDRDPKNRRIIIHPS